MDKEKVFELMLEAGCSRYCNPKHPELEGFIVNDSVLERIVALIEREVRGDAEPVVIIHSVREGGGVQGSLRKGANAAKVIGKPLYTHPAPAVVRQLVDGLAGLIDFIEIDSLRIDQDALRIARAALAAAKGEGL